MNTLLRLVPVLPMTDIEIESVGGARNRLNEPILSFRLSHAYVFIQRYAVANVLVTH